MKLTDLCPLAAWAELENEIYERTGLNPAVYDVNGIRINANPRWPNNLCPEIKAIPKGQSFICATAHMNLANMARVGRQPVIEECDAGMIKLVVPIYFEDTFLGTVGGCGHLLDDGEVDSFLVNKIVGIDEERVELLSEGIPSLSLDAAKALADYLQKRIGEIVQQCQYKK